MKMKKTPDKIDLFTDGACSGNPGPGGWAAILRWNGVDKELSGYEKETTNNRMELQAVIEGLRLLKRPCKVTVHTDSKYVMQGMTEWIDSWIKNNWKTASKKPVSNKDLWIDLQKEAANHILTWVWVKGHSGHIENERADALAVAAIEENR